MHKGILLTCGVASKNCCKRENKNATRTTKILSITLETSKFTKYECLSNFELKFKFLENLRKPLTLKSTRKRIEEKRKMA